MGISSSIFDDVELANRGPEFPRRHVVRRRVAIHSIYFGYAHIVYVHRIDNLRLVQVSLVTHVHPVVIRVISVSCLLVNVQPRHSSFGIHFVWIKLIFVKPDLFLLPMVSPVIGRTYPSQFHLQLTCFAS